MAKSKATKSTTPPSATEEEQAPLLSISSLAKKTEHVDIDFGNGKLEPHYFVNLDAIGLRERQAIADLLTSTFELGGASIEKPLTRKQEVEYDTQLRELALLILPTLTKKKLGTGKAQDGLGTGHLSDIAVGFFVSSGESVPDKLELTKRMENLTRSLPTPTGGKSSRASRRSTQGRRRGRG